MKTILLPFICFLVYACGENAKEPNPKSENREALTELEEALSAITQEPVIDSDDAVKIKFTNLTVSIKVSDASWWESEGNNNDNMYETKEDTAFFDLNPGDWMFEKPVRIEQPAFDIVELYGQLEIKVALETKREMEVPVCVLGNWKGYTSKWRKLKIGQKGLNFSVLEKQTDDPISFSLEEFKLAVEAHCGTEWLDEIRDIDAVDKLPIEFFTTRYLYKIRAKNSKTNQVIEKYLVFNTPTSC